MHCEILLHGKGTVDGVGGTIKKVVYRGLMSEKWIPSLVDDKSFAECTNSFVMVSKWYAVQKRPLKGISMPLKNVCLI